MLFISIDRIENMINMNTTQAVPASPTPPVSILFTANPTIGAYIIQLDSGLAYAFQIAQSAYTALIAGVLVLPEVETSVIVSLVFLIIPWRLNQFTS